MRKYDLPSKEDSEYLDELERMPKNVLYFLTIFILSAVLLYCMYLMIGLMNLIISLLVIGSIIVLFLYIRKGILTARKNNQNGKISKTTL